MKSVNLMVSFMKCRLCSYCSQLFCILVSRVFKAASVTGCKHKDDKMMQQTLKNQHTTDSAHATRAFVVSSTPFAR